MSPKKAIDLMVNATYSNTFQGDEELTEACLLAYEALKKQIPTKPIESEDGSEVRCPTCISKIYDEKWTNLDNLKHKHNICVYCGQRLTRVCGNGKWR